MRKLYQMPGLTLVIIIIIIVIIIIIIIIIMAENGTFFYMAGYLIEGRRRYNTIIF